MTDGPAPSPGRSPASPVAQPLCFALDSLRVPCCVADSAGTVVAWNHALEVLCPELAPDVRGVSPAVPLLQALNQIVPPSVRGLRIELPDWGTVYLWAPVSGTHAALVGDLRAVACACLELLHSIPVDQAVLHLENGRLERERFRLPGRRLQDLVAERSSDVVVLLRRQTMTYVSPAVLRMLGWTGRQLEGTSLLDLVHADEQARVREQLAGIGNDRIELQPRMRCADGTFLWVEATVAPLCGEDGAHDDLVLNLRDISIRKALELRLADSLRTLEELARTDGLTRIPNRRHFEEQLESDWRRCRREGKPLALLLLDVDQFKLINDRDGHQAGDAVLRHVAQCLKRRTLRGGDLCARFGGDEFAMIMPDTTLDQAARLAERLRADVAEAADPAGPARPRATVSIGVAATNATVASPAELLACADEALYRAKSRGRDNVLAWTEVTQVPREAAHHPSPIDRPFMAGWGAPAIPAASPLLSSSVDS